MIFIIIGGLGIVFFATLASGFAVLCQKITLGTPRTSALVAFGCSSLYLTALSSAISGVFNGVHLMGVVVAWISFSVVMMRLNDARYDEQDERLA